ncbi:MAG TPA: ABC transporter permease subunit [Candidatus Binatia bacterium]|jgi:general L-amino acid transport system permease protein|nr:ABC transporter permease subunit [Candidatus Binatia bacterium]
MPAGAMDATPFWRDIRVLRWVGQIVSAILVVGFIAFLLLNANQAMEARGLSIGFDWLQQSAGFAIDGAPISFEPSDTFQRAIIVGLLNTVRVALVGVVLATVLGVIVGLARLSSNWLVRTLANTYVETFRNVPLLVQLFFWFFAVFQQLPSVDNSITLGNYLVLNQRGVYVAALRPAQSFTTWITVAAVALVAGIVAWRVLTSYQVRTGRSAYPLTTGVAIIILAPLIAWFVLPGVPLNLDVPELGRFNYSGGTTLTTQFAALLVGLVIYTASFIAEIVRAGIQAVSRGQVEAARAIGLSSFQSLRLVIFPQALRVIIPPLISQYLNLTKNSSLAVAIGFKDLFAVGKTIIDQAGRAVSVFALIMVIYLVISLTYSIVLNLYNRRIRFVER